MNHLHASRARFLNRRGKSVSVVPPKPLWGAGAIVGILEEKENKKRDASIKNLFKARNLSSTVDDTF